MDVTLSIRGDSNSIETDFIEITANGYTYQIRPRRNRDEPASETGGLSILALDEPVRIIPSASNKIEIQGTRPRKYK